MSHPTDAFFQPKSVAIVGATGAAQKIAGRRWKTLVEGGFRGPLYPIHAHAATIRGRAAHRSLKNVPDQVDLAVVVLPVEAVEGMVRDCLDLGAGGVEAPEYVVFRPASIGKLRAKNIRQLEIPDNFHFRLRRTCPWAGWCYGAVGKNFHLMVARDEIARPI